MYSRSTTPNNTALTVLFYVIEYIPAHQATKQVKIKLRKRVRILSGLVLLSGKLSQYYTDLIWLYPASYSSVHIDLIKIFSELSSWSYAPNVYLPLH